MKAAEATLGRVFVLRLEDGDEIPSAIENYAAAQGIAGGVVLLLGGIGSGKVVVGPEDAAARPLRVMTRALAQAHEAAAVGTLFPDAQGRPVLHMHAALGRGDETLTGCVRLGMSVWLVGEVVILELLGPARRLADPVSGLALLDPTGGV